MTVTLLGLVQKNLQRHDWPLAHAYASDSTEGPNTSILRRDGAEVLQIHNGPEVYEKEGLSEAAWNGLVNDRHFALMVGSPNYIGVIGCMDMSCFTISV